MTTTRLTNGVTTLEVVSGGDRPAVAQTYPAGSFREVPAHRVERLIERYRRAGWVDPTELARHRAAIAARPPLRQLLPSARDPDRAALTASLLRQVLHEAGTVPAAAALLGLGRDVFHRAIGILAAQHPPLRVETGGRGGWRPGHESRRPPQRRSAAPSQQEKST